MRSWKSIRYHIEFAAVDALRRMVPHLSRRTLLACAHLLGRLGFEADRAGRETALENLRVVFPDWSPRRRREVALQTYRTFARTFLDLFWCPNIAGDGWRRWVRIDDPLGSFQQLSRHASLWVTPHFGSFEWLALLAGAWGRPLLVVAQDFKNGALTPLFSEVRSTTGNRIIPSDGAFVKLFKHVKRGGLAAFLTDLNVPPGKAATAIECFGLKTCATGVHALLALRTGAPLVPALSFPCPDGTMVLSLGPPLDATDGDGIQELSQKCWDWYEPHIREAPENWMWMYKHWRYLPGDADPAQYPKYANRSKKFDRVLTDARRNQGAGNAVAQGSDRP